MKRAMGLKKTSGAESEIKIEPLSVPFGTGPAASRCRLATLFGLLRGVKIKLACQCQFSF